MSFIRRIAMWIVWNVNVGSFAPRLMAFATNCSNYVKI